MIQPHLILNLPHTPHLKDKIKILSLIIPLLGTFNPHQSQLKLSYSTAYNSPEFFDLSVTRLYLYFCSYPPLPSLIALDIYIPISDTNVI